MPPGELKPSWNRRLCGIYAFMLIYAFSFKFWLLLAQCNSTTNFGQKDLVFKNLGGHSAGRSVLNVFAVREDISTQGGISEPAGSGLGTVL